MTDRGAVVEHDPAKGKLIKLLREAAKAEHCLLNTYLYSACSIRTLPAEFATVNGRPNLRRAVQFERARSWKQTMLEVAREEMRHLHYVQCLLRALGERPEFSLPQRDDDGNWLIRDWRAHLGDQAVDDGLGVELPLTRFDLPAISRFVVYESTDTLQRDNPFGERNLAVFERLARYELDFLFESMLLGIADKDTRRHHKCVLESLYTQLPATGRSAGPWQRAFSWLRSHRRGAQEKEIAGAITDVAMGSQAGTLPFQSIADLYCKEILPRYRLAFDENWVVHRNRDLNGELVTPEVERSGYLLFPLPYRDMNFFKASEANTSTPFGGYRDVEEVIKEIVEEGEGASADFIGRAESMLARIEADGGARAHAHWLTIDKELNAKHGSRPADFPDWFDDAQTLRRSHLYRFAVVMTEYWQELRLAANAGVTFVPTRPPVRLEEEPGLARLAAELPAQFNSCYLVLVAWLSRIYEIRDWSDDKARREAIEMLASWPLMSLAIRPMLEVIAYFPIDRKSLFRLDGGALPEALPEAAQLFELYSGEERSAESDATMDDLACTVLSAVADWAGRKVSEVDACKLTPEERTTILGRLGLVKQLSEFQKQFPYRVAGGMSDRPPDDRYQQGAYELGDQYEEDPASVSPLFDRTVVMRLRFAGWGRVQLATDPDPPVEEAGCTGSTLLHPADGDRLFDRALVWQPAGPSPTFDRPPTAYLPQLGVNCTEVALFVTSEGANACYQPLASTDAVGAPQTSPVPKECVVEGLDLLLRVSPQKLLGNGRRLGIDLLSKDGIRPFLNGMNHVTSKDGEPIDPFVLAVVALPESSPKSELAAEASGDGPAHDETAYGSVSAGATLLFGREIFNRGYTLLEMDPLERLKSCRGPCGADRAANIQPWALAAMSERDLVMESTFPDNYLSRRLNALADVLGPALDAQFDRRDAVDQAVSYGERMARVAVPWSTTVPWLGALLHYGHTVSGPMLAGEDSPVLVALTEMTGLELELGPAEVENRNAANSRWLVTYSQGVMDIDALSDFVHGELYVPLTIVRADRPLRFNYNWAFDPSIRDALAAFACRFNAPFWSDRYRQTGDKRTYDLDGGVVTESKLAGDDSSYSYSVDGYPGAKEFTCLFQLESRDRGRLVLNWRLSFLCMDSSKAAPVLGQLARDAVAIGQALAQHFTPSHM